MSVEIFLKLKIYVSSFHLRKIKASFSNIFVVYYITHPLLKDEINLFYLFIIFFFVQDLRLAIKSCNVKMIVMMPV